MEMEDLVKEVNLMFDHVISKGFKRVAGRAQFLEECSNLLYFANYRNVEKNLNARMFNELKSKFDALVKRTQVYEKET